MIELKNAKQVVSNHSPRKVRSLRLLLQSRVSSGRAVVKSVARRCEYPACQNKDSFPY